MSTSKPKDKSHKKDEMNRLDKKDKPKSPPKKPPVKYGPRGR